ncbi:hypothetical protein [Maridesulfovibrio ferrireducens]|uniref:hypothetical protein n=1 Tax=Maridesulfovibrio ferrireducens TaxID=246191 RepID=UPI001A20B348|nr:hypothetical protein [Maridesulfovibrio ferrireducens]MBI9112076.1 hypothetical protein [Maridesulfovibrio ferrireducens]
MTQNQTEEESKLISIPEIEEAIESFKNELEACINRIQELLKSEDPIKGIYFAQEIFESQRDKLRLEVEIDSRRKKINRIKLGMTEY